MKSLALWSARSDGGKTALTFNVAHMAARLGLRTVVLDYDPQCNLSTAFLSEVHLGELWESEGRLGRTVAACIDLVRRARGEVISPELLPITENLWLLPGHLGLSGFEPTLAEEWSKVHTTDNERALAVTTALDNLSNQAAEIADAHLVLIDVGPSLGALTRAAFLSCDSVAFPLAPDPFSLEGLRSAGPTLREWRRDWRLLKQESQAGSDPAHDFRPLGYIVQQPSARIDWPTSRYTQWAEQIPDIFHEQVLDPSGLSMEGQDLCSDPFYIATLKPFASLASLAQLARKPIFDLKVADGIGGGQIQSVAKSRKEFQELVSALASRLGVAADSTPA